MSRTTIKRRVRESEALFHQERDIRKSLKQDILKATNINDKLRAHHKLHQRPRKGSISRRVPICGVTGRTKGLVFFRRFGLARHVLLSEIRKGNIPGVYKLN